MGRPEVMALLGEAVVKDQSAAELLQSLLVFQNCHARLQVAEDCPAQLQAELYTALSPVLAKSPTATRPAFLAAGLCEISCAIAS